MYYYIFDIKKCKKRSQIEDIKSYLNVLGISGEFTYPTGAQSVSELVDLGLSKQYSTIVGIGGDDIANTIASKLVGKKEAMGFIPLEISPELAALIGVSNWREACDVLRYRKIIEIRLGKTAAGNHFLTCASLDINNPVEVTIELKDCIIQAKVKKITIANFHPTIQKIGPDFLDIIMSSVDPRESVVLSKFASILGLSKPNVTDLSLSLFRARSMRIFTKMQIPIIAGNQIIAKTPQFIESTDESLRLITSKKT